IGTVMPPIRRTRMIVVPENQMAVVPVEIVIQPDADGERRAEGEAKAALVKDIIWLVVRQVNHIWIRGKNFNLPIIIHNLLLRGGLQVADIGGIAAKTLDGIHHILLLVEKSLSEIRGPVEILVHPLQHGWIAGHGLDTRVPWLLIDQIWITAAG